MGRAQNKRGNYALPQKRNRNLRKQLACGQLRTERCNKHASSWKKTTFAKVNFLKRTMTACKRITSSLKPPHRVP